MEVLILLIAGALLAAVSHKEPKPPEPKKKPPEKPEVKSFQVEKITRTTSDGKEEVYIREITPVVNEYPVAWTESFNQRK
ncbi:MAG: hypothetical protein WBA13_05705 [Microcoleaceae cyanobacterium]